MRNDETLIFMHIPKTAGTSVSLALTNHFAPEEVFHIRADQHERAPRFSRYYGTEEYFRALPEAARRQFRCILGHTKYGLHEAIPGPTKYFTALRNPLERYYSQVAQYNRMAHGGELGADARPVTPIGFRNVKPRQFTNPQTRWVSGLSQGQIANRPPAEVLATAQRNVARHFRAVGVVEHLDRSVCQLARRSGWPVVPVGRANASPNRPEIQVFSPAELAEFQACNRLDYQLWEDATGIIDADEPTELAESGLLRKGLTQLVARCLAIPRPRIRA